MESSLPSPRGMLGRALLGASPAVLREGQSGPGLPALGWVLPPEPSVCTTHGWSRSCPGAEYIEGFVSAASLPDPGGQQGREESRGLVPLIHFLRRSSRPSANGFQPKRKGSLVWWQHQPSATPPPCPVLEASRRSDLPGSVGRTRS